MRRHARVLFAIAALASFFAFASVASAEYPEYEATGAFSGPGSADGQLATPGRSAVEQSTRNLFVVDSANNRVQVFKPNGSGGADYLTQFGGGQLSTPWGIAIDEQGGQTYVYVADAGNERIVKYASDEAAAPTFTIDGSFASPGKGEAAGQVKGFKAALAVDPTDHDLLVADPGNNRVARFEADGTAAGAFDGAAGSGSPGAFTGLVDIAVNTGGDVYVVDATNPNLVEQQGTSMVLRYSAAGSYKATLSPVGPHDRPAVVAVNRTNGEVVVGGEQDAVYRDQSPGLFFFDAANKALPSPVLKAQYNAFAGLALADAFRAQLYVVLDRGYYNGTAFGAAQIQRFTQPAVREVETAAASNPTATGVTFNGSVNPGGRALTECKFEYGLLDEPLTNTVPCAEGLGAIGSGEAAVPVHADVSGLSAGNYRFRLVAANAFGATVGEGMGFSIVLPPIIISQSASLGVTETSLRATVSPGNDKTTYHFEYGPTAAYGGSTPDRELAAGIAPEDVLAVVGELERGATYHFRLVATNSVGTTNGGDQTFMVPAGPPADLCSNAAIRAEQGISGLSGCRAYEQVSPLEKDGNPVDVKAIMSSTDGSAVAYSSPGAFPGGETSVTGGYYIGRRTADGWLTDPVDPPQLSLGQGLQVSNPTMWINPDLSRSMQVSRRALLPGAAEGGVNFYLRDNLTGMRTLAFSLSEENARASHLMTEQLNFVNRPVLFASDDLRHFVFNSKFKLTPDAPPGKFMAYELYDGGIRPVGILPGGSVAPAGASIGGLYGNSGYRSISGDGRVIAFQTPPDPTEVIGGLPLYLRIDGATTIPVSMSQRSGDPATPVGVSYRGMSRDGSKIFFADDQLLTDESTGSGFYPNLYRYDVETKDLKDISVPVDPSGGGTQEVIGSSDDGSYTYFLGKNLTDDPKALSTNIYVSDGDETVFVAGLADNARPTASISPNGRYLTYQSYGNPTGYKNQSDSRCKNEGPMSSRPDGQCYGVYVYDAVEDELSCVSCGPWDGQNGDAGVGTQIRRISEYTNRAVLDDGRVIFDTEARMVPEDTNGRFDVYEWDDGVVSLVSPGTGNYDARIADTAPSGNDVFFRTDQQLVRQDEDFETDLYDARVGGGLASQMRQTRTSAPCAGESCRAGTGAGPAGVAPATGAFSGPANAKPRRAQKPKRKHHKTKHRGKRHHGKSKKQGKNQNRASHNRGSVR